MFGRFIGSVAVAAALVFGGSVARADDANPAYKAWAKFKPGSFAKLQSETEAAGNKTKMVMTQKLVDVSPEKVTVEISNSMEVAGQKMDMPPQKMEIKATGAGAGAAAAGNAPKVDSKESAEEVKVGGKSVKCKVVEAKTEANGMKTTSKTWMSEDVPGGTVKMEANTDGAMKSSTKMELVEFEAK